MGLFSFWKSSTPAATSDESTTPPPSSSPISSTPTSIPPVVPLALPPSSSSSLPLSPSSPSPSPSSSRSHSPTRTRRSQSVNNATAATAASLPNSNDDHQLIKTDYYYTPRLQMPLAPRLLLANMFAASAGFFLGAGVGSRKAALRFRAENAHRFPKSQKQWYFYHKGKNYYVLLNGAKEGVWGSLRLAGITSLYLCMEELVDDARCEVDAVGSTIAGVTTGGVYAYLGGFPRSAIAKTAKRGAWLGLCYGVTQDIVRVLTGERVLYMDPFLKILLRDGREGDGL